MKHHKYSFSVDEDAHNIGVMVSKDLHERLLSLCNILEMNRSSLVRYLISRGCDQLEVKLLERVDAMKKADAA